MKRNAYIALALVSFFWGTTYIAARMSAFEIPGLFVAGVRQIISGALMVSFFRIKGLPWPSKKELLPIAIQAVLLLCISNGLMTWSVQYITSGLAAIIAGSMPLFVALFSILLIRQTRLTPLMITGLLVGFAGIVTIFSEHLSQLLESAFGLGVMLSLIATISWSFGTVYSSRNKLRTPILFNVGLQMLIAGMILVPVCLLTGQYTNLNQVSSKAMYALAYLVVFGSLVAYSAYGYVVTKLPPTQVAIYAYINPIVAILLGWMLLKEPLSFHMLAGAVVTLTGVYLVNAEARKQKQNNAAHMIEIVPYRQEHQPYFESLNRAWIEQFFKMEPVDEFVLRHPDQAILNRGGAILMARVDGRIAGTAALKKVDHQAYEFTKMAVSPEFRRQGVGEALCQASFEKARELGARKVILYSNRRLEPAIRMYHKLGFVEVPIDPGVYERADIKMEYQLS